MVAHRRFGPLVAVVALVWAALVARLYQVQIGEHEVWAREAANLVRSARTIPYLRGEIRDRNGEVIVRDEEAYAVRFVYREFRRHHPLGQVAHARSALEGRHAGLPLAALNLEAWGLELAASRAGDLERFARGEAVRLCGLDFTAVEPGTDLRRQRAGEVRFYVRGLLGVSRRAWNGIRKGLRKGRGLESSWIELVAQAEGLPRDFVEERLRRRLADSLTRLEQLAVQMEVRSLDGLIAVTAEESLWFLVDALEAQRREIENAIARDLFLEAAGFEAGRLEPRKLAAWIDLGFVGATLGWDEVRTLEWAEAMRGTWLEDRRSFHVPRAQVSARLREEAGEAAVEALFGELALLFERKPRTRREARLRSRLWREVPGAAVFAELPDLFEGLPLALSVEPVLPYLDPVLRAVPLDVEGAGELFAAAVPFEQAQQVAREHPPRTSLDWRGLERPAWEAPRSAEEAAGRLSALVNPAAEGELVVWTQRARDDEELLPWIERLWEARFRGRLDEALADLPERAAAAGLGLPLSLSEARLDRAAKKADYFVRDRGSRPAELDDRPGDDVVNILTRFVAEYRGFQVEKRARRLALALDEDDMLVARELIGVVRESTLEEMLAQQGLRNVFDEVLQREERGREEERLIVELVDSIVRLDEVRGTSGIEGLMDDVLRGKNGFVLNEGLQQRSERVRARTQVSRVDGRDVDLTLSLDLQKAAQRTLEDPVLPRGEEMRDDYWFRNPVGALVFATVEGEILAAASCPKQPHEPSPNRDGERAYNYERTLRMPLFQPIGSIFKPFVAAYAVARRGLTPEQVFACELRDETGTAGWGKVACWNTWGHHELALEGAIHHSCNAYFAQVGELLGTKQQVRELAHLFGFDRPSGVRDLGTGRGLFESSRIPSLRNEREFQVVDLQRAGNGLAVIEATPVQVARAVAGLATGRLPGMRLVRAVDGVPVEASYEEIDLPPAVLGLVGRAMEGVITEGSAQGKGLDADTLGFRVAGKTGSADYRPMTRAYLRELRLPADRRPPQMRKHTWFVGFFPAEAPENVLVVYCHDVGVTSSHSAVYLAAQFLRSPELQAYVRGAIR